MSDYEMPVMVRLTREEFAAALGRSADDPEIARLGGLNVVLHPISSPHSEKTVAAVAALDSAAHSNLKALGETMKPLEEKLFQRLRSNPKTAQQFLLDPLGTMEALGLIDSAMRTVIDGHRAALAGVFAPKQ